MKLEDSNIEDLIARTALKDRAAFRLLYQRTGAKLFGVALRILRDSQEAEDVLQDVFVRIWQRADRYQQTGFSPMSWLIAIARNRALDVVRARKPRSTELGDALEVADSGPDPEQSAISASVRAQIETCLSQLETDRAAAVRAAYLDGYSYEELASSFKVPLNTMRTWLRRSLLKLKECMSS